MALAIAVRYAQSLADVVLEPGSSLAPQEASGQLRAVEEVFEASPELRSVMLNPAVAPSDKRAAVTRLVEPLGIHEFVRNFIYVLIDRRRIGPIKEIRQAFEDIMDEHRGVVRADVTSAGELSEEQRGKLTSALAGLTGKQVRGEYAVNDELLGGAVAQVGSTVYDGSISGQLETLRKRLVK